MNHTTKDTKESTHQLEDGAQLKVVLGMHKLPEGKVSITMDIDLVVDYGVANQYPTPGFMYSDLLNANAVHDLFLNASEELDSMASIDPTDPVVFGQLLEFVADMMLNDLLQG
jgi:hypothetical protein